MLMLSICITVNDAYSHSVKLSSTYQSLATQQHPLSDAFQHSLMLIAALTDA